MDVKPRKSPRQKRAKVTVDAIVEATTQVLLEGGYDRFTTARAAERAGVSIGSLYQYFPNKAALVSAVIDRCCERFLSGFEAALAEPPQSTLNDSIRALVEVTLVAHHLTPELHRAVLDLAPRIGVADKAETVSRRAAQAIESMLRQHRAEIAPDIDVATAATIIETLLEALAHKVMLARSRSAQNDALVTAATRLIARYLIADG